MIRKLFSLMLFALLFLIIGVAAFTQTAYFQNKFKEYLIQKSNSTVTIAKLEGFFPFWMKAQDITLTTEDHVIVIKESSFTLLPISLLIKKLTFIHLHLKDVHVIDKEKKKMTLQTWPDLPISLAAYSLEIENLTYGTLPILHVDGSLENEAYGGNFFLNLNIRTPQFPDMLLHLNVTGDRATQKMAIITNLRSFDPNNENHPFNLWTGGTLSLQERSFIGSLHGDGEMRHKPWILSSAIAIDSTLNVSCKEILFNVNEILTTGELTLQAKGGPFSFIGELINQPLTIAGEMHLEDNTLVIPNYIVNYLDNHIAGKFLYTPMTKEIEAEGTIEAKEIEKTTTILRSIFDFEDEVKGDIVARLSFYKDHMSCKAELTHFNWNQFYISKGDLDSHWQKDKPLAFTLDIHDFDILRPSYEVFPTINLQAEGTLSDKMFKLVGTARGLGEEPFTVECNIPTYFTNKPFSYTIDRERPFSIKIAGHGSIDPLLAFLENASLIVQGELDANIEISGLWDDSEIKGYLIFSHGRIQNLTTGALLQQVEMKIQAEEKTLFINSLTAQDGEFGKIEGRGKIAWDPENLFPFHIDLKADHFLLFALDAFTATTNARIALSGTVKEMQVKGEANLVKGLITIPNKLPTTLPSLEVTYINPLPQLSFDYELPPSFPIEVRWDITVHIPKKLEIEGRGFYSDWKGEMKIQGKNKEPIYTGELTLDQGRFDFARHSFHLTKGKIRIEGIKAKEFYVDLEGNTEVDTLVVFMNVKGYLDQTKMTFTSTPPLCTEEIFSRLLFGSNLNELTPFQACRLAKFLVTLSGTYSGPSAFDNFKDSLGIDVFDITRCDIDAMDFTFQVGKYISQGTYVGINKSLSGDFDSIEIQTRLYQDFFLQANYGGSLNGITPNGGKIIFKWYKTY